MECSIPIGHLRWVSSKKNLGLTFKGIKFKKFIHRDKLTINIEVLINDVKINSRKHDIDEKDIKEDIDELIGKGFDSWLICCGHDMVSILSIGLTKIWATKNVREVDPDKLESFLRLGYEFRFFRETDLYGFLCTWEERNSPYVIFSQ